MKTIKFIVHILLILTLTSCSTITEEEPKRYSRVKAANEGGFAFNYNLENYQTPELTHYISENEIYKGNVELINYFPVENSFKVFFLLNNELINVVYNNESVKYLSFKSLKSGESLAKSFEIPHIKKGKNNLIVLLVRNPDQLLKKEDFVEFVNFPKRFTIISGNSEENNLRFNEPITINKSTLTGSQLTYLSPYGQKCTSENAITFLKINKKELKVFLNLWNDTPNKLYTIILLDNNDLIPLQNTLYKVEKKGGAAIELNITLNIEKQHNIVALIIGSPEQDPYGPSDNTLTTNKITILN